MKQYCNIPIFIPELACPHRCVFCNQEKISGEHSIPKPADIPAIVEQYLVTLPKSATVNIAFFGGSFTGIPLNLQKEYLETVQPYVANKRVAGIRLSTRPDYISSDIVEMLHAYNVTCIELGAQSFDSNVLHLSGRGHSIDDIKQASQIIKNANIELGLQMMIGLPGDSFEKSMQTAREIVKCRADSTRIYPTLVIKDTPLEQLFNKGEYVPLSLQDAIEWSSSIYSFFTENNVTVLRVGLHPSDEFDNGSLLAGPYHPSFKELVFSHRWKNHFENNLPKAKGKLTIEVPEKEINFAVGHESSNKQWLKEHYGWIKIKPSPLLTNNEINAYYC